MSMLSKKAQNRLRENVQRFCAEEVQNGIQCTVCQFIYDADKLTATVYTLTGNDMITFFIVKEVGQDAVRYGTYSNVLKHILEMHMQNIVISTYMMTTDAYALYSKQRIAIKTVRGTLRTTRVAA